MSQGLGAMQRNILAVLSERGKWLYSWEIVVALCERDGMAPTHSIDVSLRRAARSLEKRGAILSGEVEQRHDRRRTWGYNRRAFWLPGQEAPRIIAQFTGGEVEKMLLATIPNIATLDPMFYGRRLQLKSEWRPGMAFYEEVQTGVQRAMHLDSYNAPRGQMAVYRATLRLEKRGAIEVTRYPDGKIGALRIQF